MTKAEDQVAACTSSDAGAPVSFDIVVDGTPRPTLVRWLADMVGEDHVVAEEGSLRLSVPDQAAVIGVLDRLHDLGLEIERVERVVPGSGSVAQAG